MVSFTDEDLAFLDALSGSVAIAIENTRLYERVRRSEAHLREEVATLQHEMAHRRRFEEIVGTSAAMANVLALTDSAIPLPITVLLQGETGTGKELIARAIHYRSPRSARPFVTVNCRALTPDGAWIAPEVLSERIVAQTSLRVALPAETGSLNQARLTFECEYMAEVLRQNQGNAAKSARVLGISRQMLQSKIKAYGLRVP